MPQYVPVSVSQRSIKRPWAVGSQHPPAPEDRTTCKLGAQHTRQLQTAKGCAASRGKHKSAKPAESRWVPCSPGAALHDHKRLGLTARSLAGTCRSRWLRQATTGSCCRPPSRPCGLLTAPRTGRSALWHSCCCHVTERARLGHSCTHAMWQQLASPSGKAWVPLGRSSWLGWAATSAFLPF